MAETRSVTEQQIFEFEVNGVQIKVQEEKLQAIEILKKAKEYGAMPGDPEDYQLQGENQLYKAEDWVDLTDDKQFITIPTGPTDVA